MLMFCVFCFESDHPPLFSSVDNCSVFSDFCHVRIIFFCLFFQNPISAVVFFYSFLSFRFTLFISKLCYFEVLFSRLHIFLLFGFSVLVLYFLSIFVKIHFSPSCFSCFLLSLRFTLFSPKMCCFFSSILFAVQMQFPSKFPRLLFFFFFFPPLLTLFCTVF